MRYRIERREGQHCLIAGCRKQLLEYLGRIPAGEITDIRKVYKNGISDSVMEIYLPYGSRKNIT